MELIDFNWLSILFPFFYGIRYFKRFNKPLKIFFLFVAYGTINELLTFSLRHIFDIKNTMPGSNIYLIATFFLLGIFFIHIFENRRVKKLIWLIVIVFEIYSIVNLIFFQSIYEYPVVARSVGTILIILFTLAFFYKTMVEAKIKNLWSEPLIWINGALLIWYAGNLFFTILFNLILDYSREFLKVSMYYFSSLYLLLYTLISIGFIKFKKHNI